MGLLDNLEQMAGGGGQGLAQGQQGAVAQGLVQYAQQHAGGLGGLLNQFRQNGMGQHVDSWVKNDPAGLGQQGTLAPEQVQQGLGQNGLQEIAQHAGLPPAVVTMALTTLLPMVVSHLTPGGQVPQGSQLGGLAQGLLGKLF